MMIQIKNIIRPCVLFVLVFFSQTFYAQSFAFKNYDVEDGLSNSVVYRVFQDSKGYMWFSTDYGLSRFDGKEFKNYTTRDGLASNNIFSLAEDSLGDLWISCYTGGLCKMHDGKITKVEFKSLVLEPLFLTYDRFHKRLWAYNATNAIGGYVDLNNGEFILLKDPKAIEGICSVYITRNKKTLIGSGTALYLYEDEKLEQILHTNNHPVKYIDEDVNENIWLVAEKITRCSRDLKEFKSVPGLDISKSNYYHLKAFPPNKIWFNLADSLFIIDANNMSIEQRFKLPSIITAAFRDSEKNTWFSSYGKGVFRMYNSEVANYTSNDGLIGNIINGISEDENKLIWLTTNKGIDCLNNGKLNNFFKYDEVSLIRAGISIYKNTIIIAEYNDVKVVTGKNKVTKINIGSRIHSLYRDRTGKTWVTTQYGVGYLENNTYIKPKELEELNDKKVFCAFMDTGNELWFGTNHGIYNFDGKILRPFTTANGMSNDVINAITENSAGDILAATDMGISIYKNKKWYVDHEMDIVNDKKCNAIITDAKGTLWVGTYSGLYGLRNDKFVLFEHKSGLTGNEIKCLYIDSRNSLFIGTTKGLSVINLNKEYNKIKVEPPPVYITNVAVNGNSVSITTPLDLPWQDNSLRIDFKAISFSNPNSLVYQYRLAGLDTGWTSTTNNSIEFSSISSGSFTFEVRARTSASVFSDPPAIFVFQIEKPFYKKPWMILLIALMAILAGFLVFYILLRSFKNKEKQKFELHKKQITLEHRAMSALMNPHFIFNVLNSIQYYIKHVNADMAHTYLKKFTKLIRLNFDNVQKNFNSLSNECSALELYLSLEKMRFDDKFNYEIKTAQDLDMENIMIPSMIIQPFVENAIWHGIMPRQTGGKVEVNIRSEKGQLIIIVVDDGVGISSETSSNKEHNSSAMKIVRERLSILTRLTGYKTSVTVTNLKNLGDSTGTKVEIILPLLDKFQVDEQTPEKVV